MFVSLLPLAVILPALVEAEATYEPGTQLAFRGSVALVREDRSVGEATKTFDLTLLVAEADGAAGRLYWLVAERGQGAWPWVERFGELVLDAQRQAGGAPGPSLFYDHGGGQSVIPLVPPFLAAGAALAVGATWESDQLQYEVEAEKKFDERDTWQVQVHHRFGPKRTLWVEKESLVVVGLRETVFMNQGTEHELEWRLVGIAQLPDDDFAAAKAGFAALLALRAKLNRPAESQDTAWTDDERALLARHLPALAKTITRGPLVKLVRAAARDLELQSGRADAVAELSTQYEGRPVEEFSVAGLGRDSLSSADLANHVTILHFWDYRNEPLEEPYGQVGYLEFLYSRFKADGLEVYGVAVDVRLNNAETRGAVAAGVRKLKNFMNLTYPIALDGGSLLKQFGDPRLIGAPLPLFVVVGADGKIVHYHVGYYEVDRQEGLEELDSVVRDALKKKP